MEEPRKIGAVSTFVTEIAKIKPRKGYSLFFRGQTKESYKPFPSVFRHTDLNNDKSSLFSEREHIMFEQLIASCPNDFLSCQSAFDHLVKMQHYGLPTRLLDITSNPLVALYFASNSHAGGGKGGSDGEVIIYEIKDEAIKFHGSDTVTVISNLARMDENFVYPLIKKDEQSEAERKMVGKLLHSIYAEKPYFKDVIVPEHLYSIQSVRPKLDNPRVIRQSGAFLLFGMGVNKVLPSEELDNLYKKIDVESLKSKGSKTTYFSETQDRGCVLKINSEAKNKIILDLEGLGISKATLFPEIDEVAQHIKSQTAEYLKD
ncbi:FRG domain-containing protein [Shewanella sp. SM101]|uniref:FRG domain-containing protein n=1 Tax=Shewanella TaxID=22 RepID=UPI0021D7F420|nr:MULTISPECIES: FRG domain-containing protein [unclassified Shewanella]MCU8028172.1 FRG domain-containing protein [Shewanella sp. SM73]MCU8106470.1 FRG domain-containing protein [Shewanella sp. SM101]